METEASLAKAEAAGVKPEAPAVPGAAGIEGLKPSDAVVAAEKGLVQNQAENMIQSGAQEQSLAGKPLAETNQEMAALNKELQVGYAAGAAEFDQAFQLKDDLDAFDAQNLAYQDPRPVEPEMKRFAEVVAAGKERAAQNAQSEPQAAVTNMIPEASSQSPQEASAAVPLAAPETAIINQPIPENANPPVGAAAAESLGVDLQAAVPPPNHEAPGVSEAAPMPEPEPTQTEVVQKAIEAIQRPPISPQTPTRRRTEDEVRADLAGFDQQQTATNEFRRRTDEEMQTDIARFDAQRPAELSGKIADVDQELTRLRAEQTSPGQGVMRPYIPGQSRPAPDNSRRIQALQLERMQLERMSANEKPADEPTNPGSKETGEVAELAGEPIILEIPNGPKITIPANYPQAEAEKVMQLFAQLAGPPARAEGAGQANRAEQAPQQLPDVIQPRRSVDNRGWLSKVASNILSLLRGARPQVSARLEQKYLARAEQQRKQEDREYKKALKTAENRMKTLKGWAKDLLESIPEVDRAIQEATDKIANLETARDAVSAVKAELDDYKTAIRSLRGALKKNETERQRYQQDTQAFEQQVRGLVKQMLTLADRFPQLNSADVRQLTGQLTDFLAGALPQPGAEAPAEAPTAPEPVEAPQAEPAGEQAAADDEEQPDEAQPLIEFDQPAAPDAAPGAAAASVLAAGSAVSNPIAINPEAGSPAALSG